MRIGIWSDAHNFPSLPLMKLSAYHKSIGDQVEMLNHLQHYDRVYASKTFSFTEDLDERCVVQADEIVRGGSGYHIKMVDGREAWEGEDKPLPKEIEHIYPDYGLYPESKEAIGFLTRGCPRGCGFCIVACKEGRASRQVAELSEWRHDQKHITLLDPNILACREHERLLQELIESRAWVDFSQGLDVRLINADNVRLLNEIKTKMVHFAWDDAKTDLREQFAYYAKHGTITDPRRRCVYVLTNYNSTMAENLYRIYTLRDIGGYRKGFDPYVMIYDKAHATREIRLLQRWCNNKRIFKTIDRFEDYDARKG